MTALGAATRYPGGTPLDPTTRGYSLSRNCLSDLGMTVAYSHEPNRHGRTLFIVSLLLLVVSIGGVGSSGGSSVVRDVALSFAERV